MPNGLSYLASMSIGLVIGSFLNVVIIRLPQGKSIVRPGSRCPHCQRSLSWYENIPLLSFLALRGRCRTCKTPLSIRYPIVELLTAILFLAMQLHTGWSMVLFLRAWPLGALLIAITFIDLEHRIIPDVLSIGGGLLGLATSFLIPGQWIPSFLGAVLGFGAFYGLAWTYQRVTGRSGLGGGDIKLLGMLGSFIGPSGVFATIFISSIAGSLVGMVWALVVRDKNVMKFSIPFGPFLVIGALYYYLLGETLWFQFMIPT